METIPSDGNATAIDFRDAHGVISIEYLEKEKAIILMKKLRFKLHVNYYVIFHYILPLIDPNEGYLEMVVVYTLITLIYYSELSTLNYINYSNNKICKYIFNFNVSRKFISTSVE